MPLPRLFRRNRKSFLFSAKLFEPGSKQGSTDEVGWQVPTPAAAALRQSLPERRPSDLHPAAGASVQYRDHGQSPSVWLRASVWLGHARPGALADHGDAAWRYCRREADTAPKGSSRSLSPV